MDKLVSVIIPTYNSSSTIVGTISSVLSQTYQNFEIIVVDDFSKDFETLKNEIKKINSNKIKIYQLPEKKNGAYARNKGVEFSSGCFVSFLDSDDIWEESKLERQLKNHEDNTVVINKIAAISDLSLSSAGNVFSHYNIRKSVMENIFGKLKHNLVMQTSSIFMSKKDFLRIGGYDEELHRHQDFQLAISISNNLEVKYINDVLTYYMKRKVDPRAKGWSLDRTDYFLTKYEYAFSSKQKTNFLITQLLGPSLKTKQVKSWFLLCKKYKVNTFMLFSLSFLYVISRLINK